MDVQLWLAFAAASFVMGVIPGPARSWSLHSPCCDDRRAIRGDGLRGIGTHPPS